MAEGDFDELDGAVVQQSGGEELPAPPAAPDIKYLLYSAVGQPAVPTICRLNDQVARRFAKLVVAMLEEYAATHGRPPNTAARARALRAARWYLALPALLLHRVRVSEEQAQECTAMSDQIGEDKAQPANIQ